MRQMKLSRLVMLAAAFAVLLAVSIAGTQSADGMKAGKAALKSIGALEFGPGGGATRRLSRL